MLAIFVSMLALGLVTSIHCVSMCGPMVVSYALKGTEDAPGLKRVVQFRPDGLFVRQFRADGNMFDGLQDILVDEQNNRLYVISQGVLYTVNMPPLR